MMRIQYFFGILFPLFFLNSTNLLAQTTVDKIDGHWELMVENRPFKIKGVTFGYDDAVMDYGDYFEDLNSLGVNTIRTWATGEHTLALLDVAEAHGMKVMVGIWMRHGRPGMEADDSFDYLDDNAGIEEMVDNAIRAVEKYKDHPALLMWGIGNEVYLNMETDAEKEAYSKTLQRVCAKIKTIDTNHPIASVEAWTFGLDWWENLVPSLDIYGINCYGPGANMLQEELDKRGIDKPYVITEFGVTGEWDSPVDQNGVTIEPTDQEKYNAITTGYKEWIKPKPSCLGVYIFHYSDHDEFVAPWLLTHYKGQIRPQYWAIREAYTGQQPDNYPPVIEHFKLPMQETKARDWIPVQVAVTDREKEELSISFMYNQRSGSRKRRDQLTPLNHRGSFDTGLEIEMPDEQGAIKVYACVSDTYSNVGIATSSIKVQTQNGSPRKYLVPKATLPFYVYKDGEETDYISSGLMGNFKAIKIDLKNKEEILEGEASLKISYSARDNWYGIGFVDPPNDWGDVLGGYDLTGAKTFSFWAKADNENVKAEIGFGLIGKDKPFPDTAKKLKEVSLTTEWKQYKINLRKLDLSCIRSGLVIFSSSQRFPHALYLDNVIFE